MPETPLLVQQISSYRLSTLPYTEQQDEKASNLSFCAPAVITGSRIDEGVGIKLLDTILDKNSKNRAM